MTYNSPQRLTNTYQAIFQVCFQAAQPAGSALSYVLVDNPRLFFLAFTGLNLVGTVLLCTIRQPVAHPSIPARKADSVSVRQTVLPMLRFLRHDVRARSIFAAGISLGVWFNGFPGCVLALFTTTTQELAKLQIVHGIGTFAAGLLFGHLANTIGRLACFASATCLQVVSLLCMVLSQCEGGASGCRSELAFVASLLAGMGSGTLLANLMACIVSAVHDNLHAAAATQQVGVAISTVVTFMILPQLSGPRALLTLGIILMLSTGYLALHRSFFRTLSLDALVEAADGHAECEAGVQGTAESGCKVDGGLADEDIQI
mmetsp:Transcript_68916/g.224577  ORF Transcript_68916/g.224577 Transcript_68916/m.224577 type:complete len:316 (+) Transcript_68916:485-1432(+)